MTELLNCAGMTNNRCVYVVVVFILYSKLKVMLNSASFYSVVGLQFTCCFELSLNIL